MKRQMFARGFYEHEHGTDLSLQSDLFGKTSYNLIRGRNTKAENDHPPILLYSIEERSICYTTYSYRF